MFALIGFLPFSDLVEKVESGECILFLGAMASAPSPEGSPFQYKKAQAPPSGAELSRRLAAKCGYPDEDMTNLQRVSLYYELRPGGSRRLLVQAIIEEITGPEIVPSPTLHMLYAGSEGGMTFIRADLWDFVPALYEECMGGEYDEK